VGRASPDPDRARRRAALELLADNRAAFRRAARRVSICADDADDALQRATEILLAKAPAVEPRRLAAWMTVVTRREALAVRRERERLMGPPPIGSVHEHADPVDLLPSLAPGPEETFERRQRLASARAALAALKEAERLAILLQAQGYSYAEIAELCGWTYTKVNRSLAEGRSALRRAARRGESEA
jgi:RNA polymerase sigma factor (sigma-70 family)